MWVGQERLVRAPDDPPPAGSVGDGLFGRRAVRGECGRKTLSGHAHAVTTFLTEP